MIPINSRNLLTDVVQPVDATGKSTALAFVDIRTRVTSYASDDQFVNVDDTMTWGNLGVKLLGDATFWWAIADLSGTVDPFTELVPGTTVLRAPTIQRLLFNILAPENT
jgi:hypothetical protein